MKNWADRPRELRTLFNPAFCGVVLLRALKGYESNDASGIPFSLSLLVLPLCLHKVSREAINRGSRSYFTKILDDNPPIRVGLAERANDLLPYTFEAMGYLMQQDAIEVSDDGRLFVKPRSIKTKISGTEETRACQRAAQTLGKKFAVTADRVTIYVSLGLRP